jgi:hypothetical protein
MKYAGPGIFAGLILGVGIISNAFSTIQAADAASGPLHFHFIPLFGQQVIIKLSGQQSGSTQWRTNLIPLLNDNYEKEFLALTMANYLLHVWYSFLVTP